MKRLLLIALFFLATPVIPVLAQTYIAIKNIKIESNLFEKIGEINKGDTIQEVIHIDGNSMKIRQNGITGFINTRNLQKINDPDSINNIADSDEKEKALQSINTALSPKSLQTGDLYALKRAVKINRIARNSFCALTSLSVGTLIIGGITSPGSNTEDKIRKRMFISAGIGFAGAIASGIIFLESRHRIKVRKNKIQYTADGIAVTF
ncbi:MAG: hypothetical protein PUB21_10580 [Bacteroidales bacterium]|nr:hypothetical protein [Bacteroidales bacterium]